VFNPDYRVYENKPADKYQRIREISPRRHSLLRYSPRDCQRYSPRDIPPETTKDIPPEIFPPEIFLPEIFPPETFPQRLLPKENFENWD